MKRSRLIAISSLLLCVIAFNAVGCSKINATDLMKDITPNALFAPVDTGDKNAYAADFAVRLFKAANEDGKNTLISPLSVLCALAMTANGADSETREQMETALGMSVEDLNVYLYAYMSSLQQGEKYKLNLANSIWFTDDEQFTANGDFLQTNADYYGADIYKAPFNSKTLKDINNWVSQKTDKMIPRVLEDLPENAVMYLVNVLAFEAEWSDKYEKNQVRDGEFTKEDGTKQNAEFMYSAEYNYLENEKATGFIKYYSGQKYAFVALLPNEGVTVSEFISSIDGASLHKLLSEKKYNPVNIAIPKFKTEYASEMSSVLKSMGITDAFDEAKADLSGLGTSTDGNVYIDRVIHKTLIQVGEKGTKAGAATVIEAVNKSDPENPLKQVYLDRPFVYMLIDCENNVPFIIGSMTNINN